jgi:hypothetical protein
MYRVDPVVPRPPATIIIITGMKTGQSCARPAISRVPLLPSQLASLSLFCLHVAAWRGRSSLSAGSSKLERPNLYGTCYVT